MKRKVCLLILFLCMLIQCCYAQEKKEVTLYNWKDFTVSSILEDFEKKTGIKVNLREFETRDMMLSEIQSAPQEFDVIVATDVTLPLLSQYKLLAELDLTKIPNRKFIKKEFRNIPSDPQGKYGLINTWGTTGFVINTNFVPADTDSWAVLWDKKYKGKIALLDECREAMTAVLKYSHFSLNTTNHQELEIAKENVLLLKDNQVQFADTLGNLEKVKSGELWIAQVYGGDVATYAKGRKDIKYVYPKEGFTIIVDNLVISADSAHKEEAYQLINFFLEPKNAALISNTFSYPTAVEAEAFIDKENFNNPVIFPPKDVLLRGEFIQDLGESEEEYIMIFNLLKRGKV